MAHNAVYALYHYSRNNLAHKQTRRPTRRRFLFTEASEEEASVVLAADFPAEVSEAEADFPAEALEEVSDYNFIIYIIIKL